MKISMKRIVKTPSKEEWRVFQNKTWRNENNYKSRAEMIEYRNIKTHTEMERH